MMRRQNFIQKIFRQFMRSLMLLYFSEIKVIGLENLPKDGAGILAANHTNALVDGMLLLGFLPRYTHFLGKATLWSIPFVGFFVKRSGSIPIHRKQDQATAEAASAINNEDTFIHCYECLAEHKILGLFPEGISHGLSSIQPLKTGTARIALGALERYPDLKVPIIPVGLTFEEHTPFRSKALIYLGKPIYPSEYRIARDSKDREAVATLTQLIREGMESVVISSSSWDEARLLNQAAEIYLAKASKTNKKASELANSKKHSDIAKDFLLKKRMSEGYKVMNEAYPHIVQEVVDSVRHYDDLHQRFSVSTLHITRDYPSLMPAVYVYHFLLLLLVRFPLSLIGIVLNFIPHFISKFAAKHVSPDLDMPATLQIVFAVALFPLTWLTEALVVGNYTQPSLGVAMFFIPPISGLFALFFLDHQKHLLQEIKSYFVTTTFALIRNELKLRLEKVEEKMARLAELYEQTYEKSDHDSAQ